MTYLELISRSMRLIGVLASGETPSSPDANDAFTSLNAMLDNYSTQSLIVLSRVSESLSLVANQSVYQWGVGAPDFTTARPQKIEDINWSQTSGTTTVQLPIEIITQDQWAAIQSKTITSSLPTRMWPQYLYPYMKMNFWPVPSASGTVVVWSWKPLSAVATLGTTVALAPGYEDMLTYNLAIRLAPEYGKTPSEIVLALAISSKADVKRMNTQPLLMGCDDALMQQRSTWNWYTGE